jgi:hypothetical protein
VIAPRGVFVQRVLPAANRPFPRPKASRGNADNFQQFRAFISASH